MEKKEKLKVNYKYNLSEYFSFIKNYKWLIFLLIFAVLINEAKPVLDRYLFKIILDKGAAFSSGSLVLDSFIQILFVLAIVYLMALVITTIFSWIKLFAINRFDAHTIFDLKRKYFNHIIHLDANFHSTHKSGSLISRLNRGAGAMERMNDTVLFELAPLVLQAFLSIIALLYIDSIYSFIIIAMMLVFVSFNYFMQRRSEASNIAMNKTEDIEKGSIADFFTNIDSIRYFGKEVLIKLRYKILSSNTQKNQLTNWDYYNITSAGQTILLGLGTFILLFVSIKSFLKGELSIGSLTFIYTTYAGLVGPMFSFVHGIRNISRSMADFQELFEYSKFTKDIKDKSNAEDLVVQEGTIEFNKISFNYEKRAIFKDFTLKIPKNKKIALVGHSGSGKTTLVKLLYRLYDVPTGKILVDGKNIKDVKQESLRNEMSIVPQECILFDDTIFNNVQFANPQATREQVLQAIKFAQLDKIIKSFPKKENTIVGERGIKLSGGEKQRVSIARAILADKKILVLDEATSSLDSETEHEIQKDLQNLMKGRTNIIIAHRLSTIMHADTIVVMREGKIVQMGNHKELIRQGGEYQKLWNFQKGGYIE